MKCIYISFMAMSLLSARVSSAQENGARTTDTNQTRKAAPISALSGDGLSDAQIAVLKTEWADDKKKTRMQFSASFGASAVTPEEKKKYARSGKIPIRVTADLIEIKEISGKNVAKRLDGSIHLYVKDSDGKVVAKKSIPLEKMCPS
ncbi:MAG: hypothetical protein WCN95_11560 [bacterium]